MRSRPTATEEGWDANIKDWITCLQNISLSPKKWHYISVG
jgi:hypothetical protein